MENATKGGLIFTRNIHYLSVIAACLAGWILGAVWYSPPLFWDVWVQSEITRDPTTMQPAFLGPLVSIAIGLLTAYLVHGLSVFMRLDGWREGFILSLWLGLGLLVINMLGGYLFLLATWQMAAVDGAYMYLRILICCLFAAIWHKKF